MCAKKNKRMKEQKNRTESENPVIDIHLRIITSQRLVRAKADETQLSWKEKTAVASSSNMRKCHD